MSEIIFMQEQVDEMIEKTNYIIRYTTILDFDNFMEDYNRIKDLILKESYNIIKIVNTWKDDNVYKGIKTIIEKIEEYKNLGTRFIFIEGKTFKMEDILKELGRLGIDSVLLEGGSGLISTAFKENIIDAGEIFIAPKIIGDNSAVPFINGFNFDNMEDVFKISNPKFNIYGDNISIEFENL